MHRHDQRSPADGPAVDGVRKIVKRLLTIAEFSEGYGPCRTKTYQLINSGELIAVKSGRLTLIPHDVAEAWAQRLPKYQAGVTTVARKAGQS